MIHQWLNRFRVRLLFLCVFLPPVLYVFSIQGLETWLENRWHGELRSSLIAEPARLFAGGSRIEDEIADNIDRFLANNLLIQLGAEAQILVRTKTGKLLYPPVYEGLFFDSPSPFRQFPQPEDRDRVAAHNVRLMREGLQFSLGVQIPRNTWLANLVLVFYVSVFGAILIFAHTRREERSRRAVRQREEALESAREKLAALRLEASEASGKEAGYQREIEKLRDELHRTHNQLQHTENQALEEIEALESKLRESTASREAREAEALTLLREVEQLESGARHGTEDKKDRQLNWTLKRFAALYRNLRFSERAVDGFLRLPRDLQLKAEVVFQHMNQAGSSFKAKRKIAAGGHAPTVLETEFGQKGRIYWRKDASARTWILVVGTKNTQKRDLDFLSRT